MADFRPCHLESGPELTCLLANPTHFLFQVVIYPTVCPGRLLVLRVVFVLYYFFNFKLTYGAKYGFLSCGIMCDPHPFLDYCVCFGTVFHGGLAFLVIFLTELCP